MEVEVEVEVEVGEAVEKELTVTGMMVMTSA